MAVRIESFLPGAAALKPSALCELIINNYM
jgi:hypothetical protein